MKSFFFWISLAMAIGTVIPMLVPVGLLETLVVWGVANSLYYGWACNRPAGDAIARHPRQGLISFLAVIVLAYHGALRLLPMDLILTERLDSSSKIASIRRPILLIHGKEDLRVPYAMSETLCRLAGDNAALCLIEGAGHEDCCLIGKGEYRERLRAFVRGCLQRTTD